MYIKVDRLADNSGYRIRVMDHSATSIDITVGDAKNFARCVNAFQRSGFQLPNVEKQKAQAWVNEAYANGSWIKNTDLI